VVAHALVSVGSSSSSPRLPANDTPKKRPRSKSLSSDCLSSGSQDSQSCALWVSRPLAARARPARDSMGGHRPQRARRPVPNLFAAANEKKGGWHPWPRGAKKSFWQDTWSGFRG
jgi:hypothetical protein